MSTTIFSTKISKQIINLVLAVSIASQSLYMLQMPRAEAKPSAKTVIVTCALLLGAVSLGSTAYIAGVGAERARTELVQADQTQLVQVIAASEKQALSSLLGTNGQPTPQQLQNFNRAWDNLIQANVDAHHRLIPNATAFKVWWRAHAKEMIADRPIDGTTSMQDYLNAMSTLYAMDTTDVQKNPRVFLSAVEGAGDSPGGLGPWAIIAAAAVGAFLGRKLQESFVFSQLSGSINAFFAGPMDAWSQWLKMHGIQKLGWLTVKMNDRLFKSTTPPELKGLDPNAPDPLLTPEDLLLAEKNIVMTSTNAVHELRKHFYTLGFQADASDAFEYQENMKSSYIAFKNAWGNFLGDSLRDGRTLKWDLFFRLRDFAASSRAALSRADGYMNSYESVRRDIFDELTITTPAHKEEVRTLLRTLPVLAKEHVSHQIRDRKVAKEKLEAILAVRGRLLELGIDEIQATRVTDTIIAYYIERRSATFMLINFLKHEAEFREFREKIPVYHYREALRNRHGMGIDAAIKFLRQDLLDVADELAFKLQAYDRHLDTLSMLSRTELHMRIKEIGPEQREVPELAQEPTVDSSPGRVKAYLMSLRHVMSKILPAK